MTKAEISRIYCDIDRRNREERTNALQEISKKYKEEWLDLRRKCHDNGGHQWYDVESENARPHFITGEWPQRCKHCGLNK